MVSTSQRVSRAIAAFVLVVLAAVSWSEAHASGRQRERRGEIRETVIAFFHAWHVDRNANAALGQIAPEALASQYLFAESCAGVIDDVDRGNPIRAAAGVLEFLRYFGVPCNSGSPVSMFTPYPTEEWSAVKGTVLNSVKQDRFAVLRGLHAPAEYFDQTSRELRSTYPSAQFYTVLGRLELCDESGTTLAPMYMILAQHRQRTVVVSIGIFCQ